MNYETLLDVALKEARRGFEEGGIPIGAALFDAEGVLLGRGRNRRIQDNDPAAHAETDAFRRAGRLENYQNTTLVTTLAPCWYCAGLVKQFNIGTVVVGESKNFQGALNWLKESGVQVIELQDERCIELMADFIERNPSVWKEDIGEA